MSQYKATNEELVCCLNKIIFKKIPTLYEG